MSSEYPVVTRLIFTTIVVLIVNVIASIHATLLGVGLNTLFVNYLWYKIALLTPVILFLVLEISTTLLASLDTIEYIRRSKIKQQSKYKITRGA